MQPQLPSECEVFTAATQSFESLRAWVADDARASAGHASIERHVLTEVREIGRRFIQAYLDLQALREQCLPQPKAASEGAKPRMLARNLDTVLGTVRAQRVAWQARHRATVIPLDRVLDLPRELYSYGVQRFVAEQAETMSFGRTGLALRAMGIEVPRRQREQIVLRMAKDFDDFYATRPLPANDTLRPGALLVMSADSVGVRVVHGSLREDTRKAAEAAAAAFVEAGSVRGDPMEPRVGHTHSCRMAVVTMNWDQDPQPRRAEDILEQFKPKAARELSEVKLPRPQNRGVRGTVARSQEDAVWEMFEESQRRDPHHTRPWVALIDGSSSQREQILREAKERGVKVDLVLDLMHVLHYLWDCGKALHGGVTDGAQDWVTEYTRLLLTTPIVSTVSALRQQVKTGKKSSGAKRALRKCATYLENNAVALDYVNALASGYPIATGNIEGACRYLIRDRMDITGARWTTTGAEAMIKIRALQKSGDWEEYCDHHFLQEHLRSYPKAA